MLWHSRRRLNARRGERIRIRSVTGGDAPPVGEILIPRLARKAMTWPNSQRSGPRVVLVASRGTRRRHRGGGSGWRRRRVRHGRRRRNRGGVCGTRATGHQARRLLSEGERLVSGNSLSWRGLLSSRVTRERAGSMREADGSTRALRLPRRRSRHFVPPIRQARHLPSRRRRNDPCPDSPIVHRVPSGSASRHQRWQPGLITRRSRVRIPPPLLKKACPWVHILRESDR